MDVLTDSSLTLIVKTSEPENANVGESTGESPSLFLQSLSVCQMCVAICFAFFGSETAKMLQHLKDII